MGSNLPTIKVQVAEKLLPLLITPKRLKVAIGGRGASKSIGFGDAFLRYCDAGERLCCAREFQNTIDDSVHSLLKRRINALDVANRFDVQATRIKSINGGEIFYRGLARNITGFKSADGIKRIWIEEAQSLSEETIITVLPTIHEAGSEIWLSANRGASNDALSKLILKPIERELAKHGFYEDDDMIVVQINWWDNPWFPVDLQKQRLKDKETMPAAMYRHVWDGEYSDTVENAIIDPEWFDACVDAHVKLGWKAEGLEVVSFDPNDGGTDPAGLAHRHGSVIVHVDELENKLVNEGCDWALDYAHQAKPDAFNWDASGVGAGLKRDIENSLGPKKITVEMFNGGAAVANPDSIYQPSEGSGIKKEIKNRELFFNRRAQRYWNLRDRVYRTYLAIKGRAYTDPGELISFSSEIEKLDLLRSEVCRIPRKPNGTGKIQIMSKEDMKSLDIASPNMADSVMMTLDVESVVARKPNIKFKGWG